MSSKNLTSATEFNQAIKNGLSVVDFWATWCTPCRIQAPILEKASGDLPEVGFFKVDVDQNKDLAQAYSVQAIPTLLISKDGKVVQRLVGVHNQKQLVEALSDLNK